MEIKFFRGNFHQTKFKFKNFNKELSRVYFTVRCENRELRIAKSLGNGIEKQDEYYVITFKPEDTNDIPCWLDMTYDIEIFLDKEKPFTVAKDRFILEEENTRPTEEV